MSVIRSSSSAAQSGSSTRSIRKAVNPRSDHARSNRHIPKLGATKCSPPSAEIAAAASSSRPGASGSGQAKRSRSLEAARGETAFQ
jgi:hypothetical protein